MKKSALGILLVLGVLAVATQPAVSQSVKEPYTIVHLGNAFGSPMYTQGTAFEEIFKKAGSWVKWKVQETPGAMYNNKYLFQNMAKMKSGELPPVITSASASIIGHTNEGRPPFDMIPTPNACALFSSPSFISLFNTFDPAIETTSDFAGKSVGIPEKSRIFSSTLLMKPYFDKGLDIWDKVEWQFIGSINSKDALLNGRIDVRASTFMGKIEKAPDGTFVCTSMAPTTPTLEVLGSGRKHLLIGWNPTVVTKSFDFAKDQRIYPVLIKKGALKGLDRDIWGIAALGVYRAPDFLPQDVIQEIIRVRYEYRDELAKYHAAMQFFPKNPYPLGVPEKWIVPGVKKAMENLNIPLP